MTDRAGAIAECGTVIRRELCSISGDGRADALCSALRACGGRALIPQIRHSLDSAGQAFNRHSGSATEVCGGQVIQQTAWEKLHTGHWKDVHEGWRDAYSFGCLLTAQTVLSSAQAHPSTSDCTEADSCRSVDVMGQALKELDMAALMGGPLLRGAVDQIASALQIASASLQPLQPPLVELETSTRANPSPNDNSSQARIAVPLPPGSMENIDRALPSVHLPALEDFLMDCMCHGASGYPGVVTGAMEHWPAMERWQSLDYFRGRFGSRTVPVEVGRDYLADRWTQKLMTLSEFIASHVQSFPENPAAGSRGYLAQHPLFDQLPELRSDICVPEYCSLGEGEMQSINAWFGPASTVSPMHFDPHHNLLCQVVGRKYVRLFAPEETEKLYPFQGMNSNSSQVDVDAPDLEEFPRYGDAAFREVVLSPGEMLYIPPRWWHFVKSLDISFSVSFWWR